MRFWTRSHGQTAVVVPLTVTLLLAALYFFNYSQSMSSPLRYVTIKSYMHEHSNIVFEKVSKFLGSGQSPCFVIDPIYSFSSGTPVSIKVTSLDVLKNCLVGENSANIYDDFSLEIKRTPSADDGITGETAVRVSLNLTTRPMSGIPVLKLNQEKVYNLHISSLVRFALFLRQQSGAHIRILNGANVIVDGDTLRAGNQPLLLSGLTDPSYMAGTSNIKFVGKFFVQGPTQVLSDVSAESALSVFKGGLFPNVMADFATLPSMDASPAWNQNIDYHYVYGDNMGYPLPADIYSAHGVGEQIVNPVLAAVKIFPNSSIIDSLAETCDPPADPSRGDVKPMMLYQKNSDITLDLTNGNLFCGLVIAKKLRVKISDDKVSGLIGHFNVETLEIEGKGTLFIINPFSSRDLPEDLTLPPGMTLSEVARQIFAQKASVAKNFFIPFFRNSGGVPALLLPVKISSFFEPCAVGSLEKCWKREVLVLDYSPLYTQADWFKNVRFFTEKTF